MSINGSKPFTNNDGSSGTIFPNFGGSHVTTGSPTGIVGLKQGG